MKIVLDTEMCKKKGEDAALALYLLSLLSGYKITQNTFEQARKKGLLKFEQMYDPRNPFPDYVSLTETGEYLTEGLMANSIVGDASRERILALAEKMREVFPAGSKTSQNGTKHPWRGNVNTIADRLEKFIAKYGNYSDEEFIDATKRYVKDYLGKDTMRILMYFIWKNVDGEKKFVNGRMVGDKDRISMLADYLENKEEKPAEIDWEVTLR